MVAYLCIIKTTLLTVMLIEDLSCEYIRYQIIIPEEVLGFALKKLTGKSNPFPLAVCLF